MTHITPQKNFNIQFTTQKVPSTQFPHSPFFANISKTIYFFPEKFIALKRSRSQDGFLYLTSKLQPYVSKSELSCRFLDLKKKKIKPGILEWYFIQNLCMYISIESRDQDLSNKTTFIINGHIQSSCDFLKKTTQIPRRLKLPRTTLFI